MGTLAEIGKYYPVQTEGVEFPVDDENASAPAGAILETWLESDEDIDPLKVADAIKELMKMKEQYPEFVLHYIKIETRKVTVQFSFAPPEGGVSGISGSGGEISPRIAAAWWLIVLGIIAIIAVVTGAILITLRAVRGWIWSPPPPVGHALISALHTTTEKGMPNVEISVDGEVRGSTGTGGEPLLVEDLLAGPHIFTGATIAGFHPPAQVTQSVSKDETIVVELWYRPEDEVEPTTGFLVVDTTPVKGEVWVDAYSYGDAPVGPIELDIGNHDIAYGPVEDYEAPPPDTATIIGGKSVGRIGYYTKIEGPWYEKYIQYALIGGGVILGAALIVPEVIRTISRRGEKK